MNKDRGLKYTCLFGGGAIRGLAFIGAIKALEELNIEPVKFGGSSVGAIFASLYAFGYTSNELKEKFIDINFNLFKDIQFGFGKAPALSKGNVFLDWIRELLEDKFYQSVNPKIERKPITFKDLDKDLVIITTDLKDFTSQEFSRYTTPDYEIASAIRISCCMPGLMQPVMYQDKFLVDGDLQKSVPMWKLSDTLLNSPERILEMRLEGSFRDVDLSNGIDYANAVYSCMTAVASEQIRNEYGERDKFDYIILDTGDVLLVNFNIPLEIRENLISAAYNQTIDYFTKFLPVKKKKILENYNIVHGHLNRILHNIKIKNYQKAKIDIGELFINLSELCSNMDMADCKNIRMFKDKFFESYSKPGIFGIVHLKNNDIIKNNLQDITDKFDMKIEELTNYLNIYK